MNSCIYNGIVTHHRFKPVKHSLKYNTFSLFVDLDELEKLHKDIKNILHLSKKSKYVFTTGGIGPTHDDITAQSISRAFKLKYEYHKEAYTILEKYYGKKNLMTVEKNG